MKAKAEAEAKALLEAAKAEVKGIMRKMRTTLRPKLMLLKICAQWRRRSS